jgi:uncharacterized protein (DUF2147 family)
MRHMTLVSRMIVRSVVAVCQVALIGGGAAATLTDPSGTWLTEDGRARVRIERCGSQLEQICGYVVWMKEAADANGQPLRDQNNPDLAKRSRPLLGHQLILGLRPNPEGHFDGQIYNAENGKSYEISISRGATDLQVKGCMLSVFCASQTWTQTMNALPGQLVGMTGDPTGPRADKEWAPPIQVTQAKSPTVAKAAK